MTAHHTADRDATIRAVLWDFGGVILSSPFEAFNEYEARHGLPRDFIRSVNTRNPDDNAWARLERNEISVESFDAAFAEESEAFGHRIAGADVLGMLHGAVRPQMVAALDTLRELGYLLACLTNNVATEQRDPLAIDALARFHLVQESSKVGSRKPQPEFYELACRTLGVQPHECVFLDDLGINLKPAASMGMCTIKVGDPDAALAELSEILGVVLPG